MSTPAASAASDTPAVYEAMAAQEERLAAQAERIAALEAALKTKGGDSK